MTEPDLSSISSSEESQTSQIRAPTLSDLPPEIIYDIFEYLDSVFLHRNVSAVCKKFNSMLSHDNSLWKKRYYRRKQLPPNDQDPYLTHIGMYSTEWRTGESATWRDLCVSLERSQDLFKHTPGVSVKIPVPGTVVDVVHCIQGQKGYCLAGSRERSIQVWDCQTGREAFHMVNAHGGWMSGLATWGDKIVSGAWDGVVKIWSFKETMEPINSFQADLAIMGLDSQGNIIAGCTFPHLYLMDPRISRNNGQCRYSLPECSLSELNFWRNSLIVASRNKKLINFDLRMCRSVECVQINTDSSPRSMALLDDIVYVGDNKGRVSLYDPCSNFKLIDDYVVKEDRPQIRTLIPLRGQVILGTSDGVFKAMSTLREPLSTRDIGSELFNGEVTAGHYHDGVITLATQSRGNVTIFTYFI